MSADAIATLLMIGSSILIGIIIVAFAFFWGEVTTNVRNAQMQEALKPIFPDVHINQFKNVAFQIHGFDAMLHFWEGSKHSPGSTDINISFPHDNISAADDADPQSLMHHQIFKLFLKEKGFFGDEYRSLKDVKKRLGIIADNMLLQENLQYEDGLLSALRDIYLAADSVDTNLELNTNGINIHCSDYIDDGVTVRTIAEAAVKACEQALKVAARAGIRLTTVNPFQNAQDDNIESHPNYNKSDESLYDSLDESPDDFSADFEGNDAEGVPSERVSVKNETASDNEHSLTDDKSRELDGNEPLQNHLLGETGPRASVESGTDALAVQNRPKPPPRTSDLRSREDNSRDREEDESRLFF